MDRYVAKLPGKAVCHISTNREGQIIVYGGSQPVDIVRERLPHIQTITRPRLQQCIIRYFFLGWSGYVPSLCERNVLMVPANVAPWLWGWPNRFLQRMDDADTLVLLVGDYRGRGFRRVSTTLSA